MFLAFIAFRFDQPLVESNADEETDMNLEARLRSVSIAHPETCPKSKLFITGATPPSPPMVVDQERNCEVERILSREDFAEEGDFPKALASVVTSLETTRSRDQCPLR